MKKSFFRKRLFILSVLLLMVCGQAWAGRGGSAGASGSSNGINYTLYSNYSYYYYWSGQSQYLGNVAVITSCGNSTMTIPESLGGCNQIVIGEEALTSNVKSLTISKSVKLLEYCAVYNATQIHTLVIEDSETPLYCFGTKYSYSYGAFSFIEKLNSVYIGRNLEYEHTDTDHDYAPFRYCESSGNFDVTIGPNVTKIADYCFENCAIKSLTMMRSLPQAAQYNPISFGTGAFNSVTTSNVPCYVSWTTLNNFLSHSSYKGMFNYQLGAEPCRYEALEKLKQERKTTSYQDILSELEAGCAEYETAINNTNDVNQMQLLMTRAFAVMELLKQKRDYPSNAAAGIVSEYKTKIDDAYTVEKIEAARNAGKQALQDAKTLQDAKAAAIAALNDTKTSYPSDAADEIAKKYTDLINASTTTEAVRVYKEGGIEELQKAKALQDTKVAAIAALNDTKTSYPSDAADGIVTTYTDKINAATSTTNVTKEKEAGIKALKDANELQEAKEAAIDELSEAAKTYPSDASNGIVTTYTAKINAATSTTNVTNEKEAGIKALKDANELQDAKEYAIDALNKAAKTYPSDAADEIVTTYTAKINAATSTTNVTNEKEAGIKALKDANELQEAKEAAIDELSEAAKTYPSDAADEIFSTYTDKINAATSIGAITAAKEEGIQALKDANELQEAKETAISDLNDAKKDYPSDEFEDIVSIYTYKINAATTIDAVTVIKNEGIQALAYAAEMPTALHINFAEGSAPIEKEHYMTASTFTLDEDRNVVLTVNGNSVTYPWDMAGKISLFKGVPAVEIKANKDPNGSEYYTTLYSSLEAHTIPEGVKAYTATLDEKQDGVIILNEIKDGVVPAETAVVLISENGSYNAYTSDFAISETEKERGILKGTDVEIPVPDDNCYILSGTSKFGMGLYPWEGEGKKLSANKAYLQLTEASPAKAFRFVFDDETTGIQEASPKSSPEGKDLYNLTGIRVNDSYKGIVIKNGKKTLNK